MITNPVAAPISSPRLSDDTLAGVGVTQLRVVSSEWRKMRTLRSFWVTLIIAIGAMIGIGVLISWSTVNEFGHDRGRHGDHFNPLADPLAGFHLAQLAIGVLGVLLMAGEYSSGSIRASLAAVPKRLPVLWAKLGVFMTVAAVTMLPTTLVTFVIGQRILATKKINIPWSYPGVARSVIGVGLYLTVVAALGIALGAIVRNVAGAIATLVGVLLVLPIMALALPQTWGDRIDKWLPSNAGQALMSFGSESTQLSPWRGFAVFCGYAVAAVIAAAMILKRRDA